MFRYLDAQGRQRELANEAELKAAIADGRVKGATPFTENDEQWTIASRHPAYQRNVASSPPATTSQPLPRNKIAIGIFVLLLVVGITQGAATRREKQKLVAALTGVMEGREVPASVLASPPRAQRLKRIWVVMAASQDAQQRLAEAQLRYGAAPVPAEWMQAHYVTRPNAYPNVARYFQGFKRFHVVYADSLVPITVDAMRRRAAEAELKENTLKVLIADALKTEMDVRTYFAAQAEYADIGMRIHNILLNAQRFGGVRAAGDQVEFSQPMMMNSYQRATQDMNAIETRLESLERKMQEDNRKDLDKLVN